VVRVLVFGQRTPCPAPVLLLTGDNFVGKMSAMGQPIRPTQPPISSGSVKEYGSNPCVFTWMMEVETIKSTDYGYIWLCGLRPKSVIAVLNCDLFV